MFVNLLFDLDDTLLDFHAAEKVAIEKTMTHFGISPTPELTALYSKLNLMQWKLLEQRKITRSEVKVRRFKLFFEQLGLSYTPQEAAAFYEEALSKGHFFMPGAKEVLDRLYGKYKLYLVSNGLEHVQKGRLESAGICRYFEKIFLSECIGYDKPDVRFFDECFKEIPDFSKEQTLIIGDSLSSDMTGGKNAGIFTVWFNPQNSENNSDVKPDMQIHSLDEIPSCFENLA